MTSVKAETKEAKRVRKEKKKKKKSKERKSKNKALEEKQIKNDADQEEKVIKNTDDTTSNHDDDQADQEEEEVIMQSTSLSSSNDVSTTATTSEVTIKVAKPISTTECPLVVSFLNGVPSSSSSTAPPTFTWHKAHRADTVVTGRDSTCTYTSSSSSSNNNNGDTDNTAFTKLIVGIFDRRTNSLTLHETADRGRVFPVTQTIIATTNNNNGDSSDDDDDDEGNKTKVLNLGNLTEAEKRRVLFDSFGSSKKKKQLRGQDANRVNASSSSNLSDAVGRQAVMSESNVKALEEAKKTMVDTKRDTMLTSTAVTKAFEDARRAFLPPFNTEAKRPCEVYNPERMCDEASWSQIARTVDGCIYKFKDEHNLNADGGDDDNNDNNPGWVTAITSRGGQWNNDVEMEILRSVQDPMQNRQRIRCTLLLHHCINFYKYFHHSRDGSDGGSKRARATAEDLAKRMQLPYDVANRLLELFCVNDGDSYAVTKQLTNKLMVYMLLLYLMASGGKEMKVGSIQPLVTLLRVESNMASNLLRQAGCTVASRKSSTTVDGSDSVSTTKTALAVTLNVPLKFPPPKRKRGG